MKVTISVFICAALSFAMIVIAFSPVTTSASNPFSPVLGTDCTPTSSAPSNDPSDLFGTCVAFIYPVTQPDPNCGDALQPYSGGIDQSTTQMSITQPYNCVSQGLSGSNALSGQASALTHDTSSSVTGINTGYIGAQVRSTYWDSLTVTGECHGSTTDLSSCIDISWSVSGSGSATYGSAPSSVNVALLYVFTGSVTNGYATTYAGVYGECYNNPTGGCAGTSGTFSQSGALAYPFTLASGETIFWGATTNVIGEDTFSGSISDPVSIENLSPCTPASNGDCVTLSISASQQQGGLVTPVFPFGSILAVATPLAALGVFTVYSTRKGRS